MGGWGREEIRSLQGESLAFLEDIHMEQTYGIHDSETGTQDQVPVFV